MEAILAIIAEKQHVYFDSSKTLNEWIHLPSFLFSIYLIYILLNILGNQYGGA